MRAVISCHVVVQAKMACSGSSEGGILEPRSLRSTRHEDSSKAASKFNSVVLNIVLILPVFVQWHTHTRSLSSKMKSVQHRISWDIRNLGDFDSVACAN